MNTILDHGHPIEVGDNRLLTACCDQADCDCLVDVPPAPAEACTELGADSPPRPRFAYLLEPAFRRWPRGTVAVLLVTLLALWGFADQLDEDAAQEFAALSQPNH